MASDKGVIKTIVQEYAVKNVKKALKWIFKKVGLR